jgi:eukaryotic-like serine/threonine-protein kinase
MIGQTISHYRIIAKLGEGGMGVVYKAEDAALDRVVAIKFLPAHLLASADDRSRFNREAKAAASLNHPNIATIFEINEHEDEPFIVMEYIEGSTLKEIVEKELFKLKDAVSVAVQAAEGLKAAHAKNIVHRDIKSANILLSHNGQAKILDFGLAKTTMATQLTKAGSTLGTVAYMSPEQVSGLSVDHRTDLWSLGVILFEMLTGRMPFVGDYDQVIFYKILNEPLEPITSLRSGIPLSLEWIVTKLLAKEPDERYQNANDLIIDLKAVDVKGSGFTRTGQTAGPNVLTTGMPLSQNAAGVPKQRSQKTLFTRIIPIAIVLGAAIVSGIVFWNLHSGPEKDVRKFQWQSDYSFFVLSPDGKKVAYSKGEHLWIRRLDKTDAMEIKNDDVVSNVVWAPNSEYIAFFTGLVSENHLLNKVSLNGVQSLVAKMKGNYYPRFWGRDDSILVTTWNDQGWNMLLKVSSSGGDLIPIHGGDSAFAMVKGDVSHVAELPDGKTLLIITNQQNGEIIAQTSEKRVSLFSGPPESYIDRPVYSPSGHLLYPLSSRGASAPDIWAVAFEPSSLKISGKPFLVARSADHVSVSDNGLLSYMDIANASVNQQMVMLTRSGQYVKNISQPQLEIHTPAMSPDGKTIATMSADNEGNFNIWLHDIARGTKSQLSFDVPNTWKPSWSPDGKEIVFQSGFFEKADLYVQSTDGRASAKPLLQSPEFKGDASWSPDGRFIVYAKLETYPHTQSDIWYLEAGTGNAPKRLFESRFNERQPCISPDGRYVAFASDKSGRLEIYVADFPKAERQWEVSFDGGAFPQWIRDEIFYAKPKPSTLVMAKVTTKPAFRSENPVALFTAEQAGVQLQRGYSPMYAVTRDGNNIIAVKGLGESNRLNVVFVENWIEEFKEKK